MRVAGLGRIPKAPRVPPAAKRVVSGVQPSTYASLPLKQHASGRYLTDSRGVPFPLHVDTPWSLPVQLTASEIRTFIQDRAQKRVTGLMWNAIEHNFTSQTPKYRSVGGFDPFASMTDFGSAPVEGYWALNDVAYAECIKYGIVPIINFLYLGYAGTEEGWDTEVAAESDADLFAYGAWAAARYPFAIPQAGGDQNPDSTLAAKQWQFLLGWLSVVPAAIITAHGAPQSDSLTAWGAYASQIGLNFCYPETAAVHTWCATSYGRSPAKPFWVGECIYEGERGTPITAAGLRRQSYQAWCSGACGQGFGNAPIWSFGAPNRPYTGTGTWQDNLNSTGSIQQQYVREFVDSIEWWKLEPKTDTSLVSSSLSSGDTAVCPALANDGSFAVIWSHGSQTLTVNTNALTGISGNVRIRRRHVDASNTYTTINASVAKTSSQSVATGGEGVIVIDAA